MILSSVVLRTVLKVPYAKGFVFLAMSHIAACGSLFIYYRHSPLEISCNCCAISSLQSYFAPLLEWQNIELLLIIHG